ncbi:hypothetical protein [Rhodococcus sp. IEGM 1374]|uniref:hypothetical protein n=1 Tax=Rhodococcus sp. IEGM 1374 TaxID=3082221 RepID=UPI0029557579|nr:hypothetical protein [Rhodococcus sp. IEGM 1374]MDV7992065.1 hypothetical protein [Rhodococcus sp. IEGM 1374]
MNLLIGTVQIAPSPSTTGENLTLMPGDGARFESNMPVTIFPDTAELPTHDNSEIGYLRAADGDQLTITRAQERSNAMQVAAGWKVMAGITAKTLTDIEDAVQRSSDRHFTQNFTSAAVVVCAHELGKKPSVTVIDSAGDEVEGEVEHRSVDELVVRFSSATSGQVILN